MGTPLLNAQSRHSSIIVVKVYFRLYTDKIFFHQRFDKSVKDNPVRNRMLAKKYNSRLW